MKKFIALLLVVALTATVSVSATMAYLQDTDEQVNVMTMGNVKVELNEKQRNDDQTALVDFEQGKLAMPYVDHSAKDVTFNLPTADTHIDKIVYATNTGKSDAYMRILVAIPAWFNTQTGDANYDPSKNNAHWNYPGNATSGKIQIWLTNNAGVEFDEDADAYADYTLGDGNGRPLVEDVTIDGSAYDLWSFTFKNPISAGKSTNIVMTGLYLDKRVDNDDSGNYLDIDGNVIAGFDGNIIVPVMVQAVQTTGFTDVNHAMTEAFGEANATNAAAWFAGVGKTAVSNNEELAAAIEAGDTNIVLGAGTYQMPAAAKGKTLTISGTKDSIIEVVPQGQSEANGQLDYSLDGSTVEFNGVTIKTNSQLYAGYARLSATYNNCVIQNTYNLGTGNSAFYDCEINITNEYLRVGGASSAIFDGCTFNTDGRAILVYQDGTSVAQTVTVKDCTFNATAAANTWNGIHVAAVSIDGTSGTYVVNLEGNNTVDSDFNGLWQIKKGAENVTVNGLN